jgi:hypothetical protein
MNVAEKYTLAIMQPTYFPWIGYFDLIDQSKTFVLLDDVEFSKQSWQQRNRIKTANGVLWLTVPVLCKGKSKQLISEAVINRHSNDIEKHIKTIKQSYSKASFLNNYIDELSNMLSVSHQSLAELNINLIKWFCEKLGIKTKLVRSSELRPDGSKVERLINICHIIGANRYLSTPGSKTYIEENNLFVKNNIELVYHNYHHPVYKQQYGEFVPYLSAIDLLLNEGESSLSIVKTGRVES